MKIEKFKFEHREFVKGDRVFQGHTAQMDYFPKETNFVNVVFETDGGPVCIQPCLAKGSMTGITISADLEQGILSMQEKQQCEDTVVFPIKVVRNPYRREPWIIVILYVTEHEIYEPIQKIILDDKIILTFQVLHVE